MVSPKEGTENFSPKGTRLGARGQKREEREERRREETGREEGGKGRREERLQKVKVESWSFQRLKCPQNPLESLDSTSTHAKGSTEPKFSRKRTSIFRPQKTERGTPPPRGSARPQL